MKMKPATQMMLMSKKYGESAEKKRMGEHGGMRERESGMYGREHGGMNGYRSDRMRDGREWDRDEYEGGPHGEHGSRGEHDRRGGWQNREMIATGSAWINPGKGAEHHSGGGFALRFDPVYEPTAMRWVHGMEQPEGGRPMPAYKPEEAEALRKAHCPDCEKWEFFVAINMMYSDMLEVAKKFNVDKPEYYACMAKAFLKDKDAGKHKLRKYMEMIPKG